MSSTFFNVFLPLFLVHLFIISSSTYATRSHFLPSTTLNSSKQQTEDPITSPDIFSQDDHNNTFKDDSSTLRFIIPSLAIKNPRKFLAEHAGYIPIPYRERMFHFFFPSRNNQANDPFILWLNGGPGASGCTGLFYENGPFTLKDDDLSLVENKYSWDKMSNILFVDQPMGTGFSHLRDDINIRRDSSMVINDLYKFLQNFFDGHRDFSQNDFFIIGQTYSGNYAPALAARIQSGNNEKGSIHINLKGFAIGNGHTNPRIQYPTIPEYARSHDIITEDQYAIVTKIGIEAACIAAFMDCGKIVPFIDGVAKDKNLNNIEKPREGSPSTDKFSKLNSFLNTPSIKEALSAGEKPFVSLSREVFKAMIKDYMKSVDSKIAGLLEERRGIKVLIYVGDQDLVNNWIGIEKCVSEMNWYGKEEFNGASDDDFVVDDTTVGSIKKYGPLTYVKNTIGNATFLINCYGPFCKPKMLAHPTYTIIVTNMREYSVVAYSTTSEYLTCGQNIGIRSTWLCMLLRSLTFIYICLSTRVEAVYEEKGGQASSREGSPHWTFCFNMELRTHFDSTIFGTHKSTLSLSSAFETAAATSAVPDPFPYEVEDLDSVPAPALLISVFGPSSRKGVYFWNSFFCLR
ncbi:serine carboxypeptidase-like [Tripterygium wilfordii]|uniref:serine carboxypeptidase-like n=1 Tax=Tripterygium wilfordii TaxID=458696 RepID=UPI0018F7FB56|nr:serine carboxypeptidase-like [Tripterygium wilfordii]